MMMIMMMMMMCSGVEHSAVGSLGHWEKWEPKSTVCYEFQRRSLFISDPRHAPLDGRAPVPEPLVPSMLDSAGQSRVTLASCLGAL